MGSVLWQVLCRSKGEDPRDEVLGEEALVVVDTGKLKPSASSKPMAWSMVEQAEAKTHEVVV